VNFKKVIRGLVVTPAVALVLIGSSGFTFYLHSCRCEDKTILSISNEINCVTDMGHNHATHSCCIQKSFNHTDAVQGKHCSCSNEKIILKLNDYAPLSPSIDLSLSTLAAFLKTIQHSYYYDNGMGAIVRKYYNESDSPPTSTWGKELHILYRSLKFPETLS